MGPLRRRPRGRRGGPSTHVLNRPDSSDDLGESEDVMGDGGGGRVLLVTDEPSRAQAHAAELARGHPGGRDERGGGGVRAAARRAVRRGRG